MNEIEYRAESAKNYREYLSVEDTVDTVDAVSWCVLLGLWETYGWICSREGSEEGAPILKWLEPGQRDG